MTKAGVLQDFISAALKSHTDDCIEWPFGKIGAGYGVLMWKGRRLGAHRAVCLETHGNPSALNLHAAHACGNPACVNPRHISWKSPVENNADKKIHRTENIGERHGLSKLTNAQAQEVREMVARGATQRRACDKFGVSPMIVSRIVRRESYVGV